MDDGVFNFDGVEYTRAVSRATVVACPRSEVPWAAGDAPQGNPFWWQDGANPDVVWTKILLDSEGANANWDYMPRPALLKHFGTAKYKPMDMDHIVKELGSMVGQNKENPPTKNTIFGVMTYACLADASGNPLDDDARKALADTDDMNRPTGDRVTVVAYAALYSFLFPKTTGDVLKRAAAGKMHCSMERWIKEYDFIISDGNTFKSIPRAQAEKQGIANKWSRREFYNGQAVLRRSLNFLYGGVASTSQPANPMATYLPVAGPEFAAQAHASDALLGKLYARHDEVHRLFDVSTCADERELLVAEHAALHKAIAAMTELKSASVPVEKN